MGKTPILNKPRGILRVDIFTAGNKNYLTCIPYRSIIKMKERFM